VNYGIQENTASEVVKHATDKGDFVSMKKHLQVLNWKEIMKDKHVKKQWAKLCEAIKEANEKFIPHKNPLGKGNRHRKPQWMNERILSKIKRKKTLLSAIYYRERKKTI
jgi:hypothetical protein